MFALSWFTTNSKTFEKRQSCSWSSCFWSQMSDHLSSRHMLLSCMLKMDHCAKDCKLSIKTYWWILINDNKWRLMSKKKGVPTTMWKYYLNPMQNLTLMSFYHHIHHKALPWSPSVVLWPGIRNSWAQKNQILLSDNNVKKKEKKVWPRCCFNNDVWVDFRWNFTMLCVNSNSLSIANGPNGHLSAVLTLMVDCLEPSINSDRQDIIVECWLALKSILMYSHTLFAVMFKGTFLLCWAMTWRPPPPHIVVFGS